MCVFVQTQGGLHVLEGPGVKEAEKGDIYSFKQNGLLW